MPPSFPLGPNLVILSDDEAAAWDEVASRSYAGYSSASLSLFLPLPLSLSLSKPRSR